MDITLTNYMRSLLDQSIPTFHRYIFDQIDWNDRLFAVVGPRGVGKTTMFLQYTKAHLVDKKIFYVSADNIYFSTHTLIELADEYSKEGGEQLFIDEIHKYAGWSKELKQVYDTHPDLKIGITGSSVLDILDGNADLSRRCPMYTMQGLSFREYLKIFEHIDVPVFTLDGILANQAEIPEVRHPLPFFKTYLKSGYYPFAKDSEFNMRLLQIINLTLEVDIPLYAGMNASTGRKLKRLLSIIAKSVPFKPVIDKISRMINVSRNDLGDYLLDMEKAGLISQLRDDTGGIRGLGKVEKIYLDNTNLAYELGGNVTNIGNIRETFFYNQMRVHHDTMSSRISDFTINGKTFEIGGRGKEQSQIAGAIDGYIVKDDIEYGEGNMIPLWAFGLNY
jgi:predicted AAA+ superfamily ATPase